MKSRIGHLYCRTSDKRMHVRVDIDEKQVLIGNLKDTSYAVYKYPNLPISYLSISVGPNKNGLISIEYDKDSVDKFNHISLIINPKIH